MAAKPGDVGDARERVLTLTHAAQEERSIYDYILFTDYTSPLEPH